jgi:hypothetical protein
LHNAGDVEILMRQADVNNDQMISWAEFKDGCLNDTNAWGLNNYDFRGLISFVAQFHATDPGVRVSTIPSRYTTSVRLAGYVGWLPLLLASHLTSRADR